MGEEHKMASDASMIGRRMFLAASAVLATPALAQRTPVLRFVPQANLTSLDPIWTTATVTNNHSYYVYDTLYAMDATNQPRPQMAEGHQVSEDGRAWTIKLRDGLQFHDGVPVRSRDCAASLGRWSKRDSFGQLFATVFDRFDTPDDRTLVIRLQKPFPLLLNALGHPHPNVAWIMPERIASTDLTKSITDATGSGPYRFLPDEFVSGSFSAYQKFDRYQPRSDPPSWGTGAKVAHFPRVEWHVIPDPATAAAALQRGEVDWWEQPLPDLLPALAAAGGITLQIDQPYGRLSYARLNHLQPPFNDLKARQAFMMAVKQEEYMQATQGDDASQWLTCRSLYPRNTEYWRDDGKDLMRGDLQAAKRLLSESRYSGEAAVILSPTDFPLVGPMGQVTAALLQSVGFKTDLRESDLGTLVQRRVSRKPVAEGGWSVFHSFGGAIAYADPGPSPLIGEDGAGAWFGWPSNPRVTTRLQDWLEAPDSEARKRAAQDAGAMALEDVATLPLGQFYVKTAFRTSITGVAPGPAPYPFNVRPV